MKIFVKTMNKTLTLEVEPSDLVSTISLDAALQQDMNHLQRVTFAGKKLKDDRSLAHYNIEEGNTLHIGVDQVLAEVGETKPQACPTFKEENCFETREAEATHIRAKYPHRIPVICEAMLGCKLPIMRKKKYLVPDNLTVGQLLQVIRNKIRLDPQMAMFVFIDGVLPPTADLLSAIYARHADKDGFLYVTYSGENTFG
jgi:GABA(A) receptor-associated protein